MRNLQVPKKELSTLEKLITHTDADGISSAMLIKDAIPGIKVVFMDHGDDMKNLQPEEGMIFCDLSPYEKNVAKFIKAGAIVLDHHKSTKNVVMQFGNRGVHADEKEDKGVSGVSLAYKYIWLPLVSEERSGVENKLARRLAKYVSIWDTHQVESPFWERALEYKEAIEFYPRQDMIQDPIWENWLDKKTIGKLLVEKRNASIQREVKNITYATVKGIANPVAFINGGRVVSYLTEVIDAPLICEYRYESEDLKVSLRTKESSLDIEKICKAYGGGGHAKAGGFAIEGAVQKKASPLQILITALEAVL